SQKLSLKGVLPTETKEHLVRVLEILTAISEEQWTLAEIKERVMAYADTLPKRGPALHPLRYSLSGREQSPDPFTIASIIGKMETERRIEAAITVLSLV